MTDLHCFSCGEDNVTTPAVVWQDEGDRMGILGACDEHKATSEEYWEAEGETIVWIDHPSHGPDCNAIADGGICGHFNAWIHETDPTRMGAGERAVCGASSDRGALRVSFGEDVTCPNCLA